jgi:hypothetical protein
MIPVWGNLWSATDERHQHDADANDHEHQTATVKQRAMSAYLAIVAVGAENSGIPPW